MIKPSTMLFLFSAILFFVGGIYFLTIPAATPESEIEVFTTMELSFYNTSVSSLSASHTSLVNVIGANLSALALLTIYVGFKAWNDQFAWGVGLLCLVFYLLPLLMATTGTDSSLLIVLIPAVPYAFGLVLATVLDRSWEWPSLPLRSGLDPHYTNKQRR